jgi:hypothetical protein
VIVSTKVASFVVDRLCFTRLNWIISVLYNKGPGQETGYDRAGRNRRGL